MGECFITRRGGDGGGLPQFTYTGRYELIDDGRNGGRRNWRIKLKTSGELTFTKGVGAIDVFLVGGGGFGGTTNAQIEPYTGAGAFGGMTQTYSGIAASLHTVYPIQIGAGAESDVRGGSSTAFGHEAAGGTRASNRTETTRMAGGSAGAVNDAFSEPASDGGDIGGYPCLGQGRSTREFGAEVNALETDVTNTDVLTLRDPLSKEQRLYLSEAGASVTVGGLNGQTVKIASFDAVSRRIVLVSAVTAAQGAPVWIGTLYAAGGRSYRTTVDSLPADAENTGNGGAGGTNMSPEARKGYSGIVVIRNHRETA